MEKVCTGCKETKTLNEYYWREKRNNYSAKCKICWSQESKNYNLENKEKRTCQGFIKGEKMLLVKNMKLKTTATSLT